MKKNLLITGTLLVLFSVTSSFSPTVKELTNQASRKTCSVGMFLKHHWHSTFSSLSWVDDDLGYIVYNLGYDGYFESYFDSPDYISIELILPQNHPSGHMRITEADTHVLLYCVNFTSSQQVYTFTIPSPTCNQNYIVGIEDGACY